MLRPIQTDQERAEYTPIGHSMSLAARMEAMAPIGSVMVTDHIFKLTEGYFEFRALGPTAVKGVRDPLKIYEVLGSVRCRPGCSRQPGAVCRDSSGGGTKASNSSTRW